MLPLLPSRAPLSAFNLPNTTILTGEHLAELKNLEASVIRFGLLNPIVVAKSTQDGSLQIIDGQKRLTVIKRLAFAGKLPRSLQTIPYIVADVDMQADNPLALLSPIEQFEQVQLLVDKGLSDTSISLVLYAPASQITDLRAVERLSDRLRNAFFGGHIDLSQARAFATLPNPDSQDALLLALGPFAKAPQILDAIASGETVVSVGAGEDDILILPSRELLAA